MDIAAFRAERQYATRAAHVILTVRSWPGRTACAVDERRRDGIQRGGADA